MLDGAAMGTAVVTAMNAVTLTLNPGDSQEDVDAKLSQYRTDLIKAMCTAICAHITTNAVVQGPVAVTSVSGVTTGSGVSGAGVGTLSNGKIL